MKQEQFESVYRERWQHFESLLEQLEQRSPKPTGQDLAAFPALYRQVCQFLALARERQYSAYLIEELNDLMLRGHHQLYQRHTGIRGRLSQFWVLEFPQLVREQQGFIWTAFGLLYLPALLFFAALQVEPHLIYSLLNLSQVMEFEYMYNPASDHIGRNRESESDFMMFGFYIYNNISVAFRCFAGGLLLMLGSAVALVFNGLLLGGVAGHLANVGYPHTLFSFVIGHGAFELTAIGIAGGAGLKLGYSLLVPGSLSRLASLRLAAATGIRLMYGVILMLLIAAFIEAFWSSNGALPLGVKYGVGAALWLLVLAYFGWSGRGRFRKDSPVFVRSHDL